MSPAPRSVAKAFLRKALPYPVVALVAQAARLYVRHSPFPWGKRAIVDFPLFDWFRVRSVVRSRVGTRYSVRFPDLIQKYLFYFGFWEPGVSNLLLRKLSPGDTFVDVGANIGYHSCLAASIVGPTGRVHAIEPSPSISDELRFNIELNELSNVTIHRKAASDRAGRVKLYKGDAYNIGETTTDATIATEQGLREEAEVPAFRLHEIVGEETLLRARLIKVDIEGAELSVIRGVADLLERFSPETEWLVEMRTGVTGADGGQASEILDLFSRAGYRSVRLLNRYASDWYIRDGRRVLASTEDEPIDRSSDLAASQMDVLFTRAAVKSSVREAGAIEGEARPVRLGISDSSGPGGA